MSTDGKELRFALSTEGVRNNVLLKPTLKQMERQVAERALSEAKAAFAQEFGREPNLTLEFRDQPVGGKTASYYPAGVRPTYRISAGDAATFAILRAHPGWLGRFSKDAKL